MLSYLLSASKAEGGIITAMKKQQYFNNIITQTIFLFDSISINLRK